MKIVVAGLVNLETTMKVKKFPIPYYPIDYPFFGIHTEVAGVAYNVGKALKTLGNDVELISFTGADEESKRIRSKLAGDGISDVNIHSSLQETPVSLVLYDETGRRQIYCDLKDIQDKALDYQTIAAPVSECDMVVACNINFNRPLLKHAKEMGKVIATDVHVLSDMEDTYNKEFMECVDILFLSDDQLPCAREEFMKKLSQRYPATVIVMGCGADGAMLYEREVDTIYQLSAVTVGTVVNTVGAGDALFSSFLNYYGKGYDAVESLKRAEIFASLKITANGGALGFSDEATIESYYKTCPVTVQEVS